MKPHRTLALVLPLTLWTSSFFGAQGGPCGGCSGSSTTDSGNGTVDCPSAFASLSVLFENGNCKAVANEDFSRECVQKSPCKATVTRSWSGVPLAGSLEACVWIEGTRYCLDPPPWVFSPNPLVNMYEVSCGAPAFVYEFNIPNCGIFLTSNGVCSSCP